MRVLHISSAHHSTGAGYAAYNLHLNLRKAGVESDILFISSSAEGTISFEKKIFQRLKRMFVTKLDQLFLFIYFKKRKIYFSPGVVGLNLNKYIVDGNYDIVHLHWINHGFLKLNSLVNIDIPVIWTMHDLWPITGGCHYSYDCLNYTKNCGNCYVLGSTKKMTYHFIHLT